MTRAAYTPNSDNVHPPGTGDPKWLGKPRRLSRSLSAPRSTATPAPSVIADCAAGRLGRSRKRIFDWALPPCAQSFLAPPRGGGFPQWNSNAEACRRARAGDSLARARTQASVAVCGDEPLWTLLNASPDLRQQINATPELHPAAGLRSSPIAAVVLTSGEVDSIAGLLNLRERQPFTLFATDRIHAVLDANPIFNVLARDIVTRRIVALEEDVALARRRDVAAVLRDWESGAVP